MKEQLKKWVHSLNPGDKITVKLEYKNLKPGQIVTVEEINKERSPWDYRISGCITVKEFELKSGCNTWLNPVIFEECPEF